MLKSRRYCMDCKKITTFKRNRADIHSKCEICHGVRSQHRGDKPTGRNAGKKRRFIKEHYEEELEWR